MNEITELTRFRETIPDDQAARVRARSRLVSRAVGNPPLPRTANRRGLTRRRLVIVVAAAVVASGGVVTTESLLFGDQPVGATAEAATLLQQAADRAIGSTDPVIGPDEYLHVTTVAVHTAATVDAIWLETYTNELFVPGDPANEWVLRRSARVPFRPEDAEVAARYGLEEGTDGFTKRAHDGAFFGHPPRGDWGSPTPEFFAGLPRDPQQLLDEIRRYAGDAGPSRDGEALVVIADVLRSGITPGDVRAALFQAAALIPGVDVTDEQANLNGQIGVAVGRYEPSKGERQEIIFNPDTGMVIGERDVLVDRGRGPLLPVGSTASWTAVVTDVVPAATVDEIPADPRE
jgi:RNA polymerase sigma-70 factor (ECF subfamily)